MNRVTVLTPAGTGAIATLEVAGPDVWPMIRQLFQPANGRPLPEFPILHRTWFGTIGDEVVLAVRQLEPELTIEVHAHGGPQVVKWLLKQFADQRYPRKPTDERPWGILEQAKTLRTAAILLDQFHGAFVRAIRTYFATESVSILERLADLAPVGKHLVAPWKVVIAGAPNVGKSSLVNALAGYQRSIVSPTAGTTRDVVTTLVALDGWPVELADTAGLRRAKESLEASGIALAEKFLREADLVVWLLDGQQENPTWPTITDDSPKHFVIFNKIDQPIARDLPANLLRVSATTGEGLPKLIEAIVEHLVPVSPHPGEAVPYTPQLAEAVCAALADPIRRKPLLANCLAS